MESPVPNTTAHGNESDHHDEKAHTKVSVQCKHRMIQSVSMDSRAATPAQSVGPSGHQALGVPMGKRRGVTLT